VRRAVWVLLGMVTVAALLLLFLFPVRTLIDQRDQTALAQRRIQALAAENAALAKHAQALQTNAEIEQLARDRYGLQMPDDHIYTVLPAAGPTTTTTTPAPASTVPRGG